MVVGQGFEPWKAMPTDLQALFSEAMEGVRNAVCPYFIGVKCAFGFMVLYCFLPCFRDFAQKIMVRLCTANCGQ